MSTGHLHENKVNNLWYKTKLRQRDQFHKSKEINKLFVESSWTYRDRETPRGIMVLFIQCQGRKDLDRDGYRKDHKVLEKDELRGRNKGR